MNKQLLEAVEHIIRSEFSTVRQKAVAVVELVEKEAKPVAGETPGPCICGGRALRISVLNAGGIAVSCELCGRFAISIAAWNSRGDRG